MKDRNGKQVPIGSPPRHSSSPRTLLLRAGSHGAAHAGKFLGDPALLPFLSDNIQDDDVGEVSDHDEHDSADRSTRLGGRSTKIRLGLEREELIDSLALTADPDMALLNLAQLAGTATAVESAHRTSVDGVETGGTTTSAALLCSAMSDPVARSRKHRRRLLAALSISQALDDFLVTRLERLAAPAPDRAWDVPQEPGAGETLQRAVRDMPEQTDPVNTDLSDSGERPSRPGDVVVG